MTLELNRIKLNNLLIREGFPSLIFFIVMESVRAKAINWWTNLSYHQKDINYLCFGYIKYPERCLKSLTGREIEHIYLNSIK